MFARTFHPYPEINIIIESNKSVGQTITISENGDLAAEATLDFFHQLQMSYFGMNTNCNKVICYAVENFDLYKCGLWVGRGY